MFINKLGIKIRIKNPKINEIFKLLKFEEIELYILYNITKPWNLDSVFLIRNEKFIVPNSLKILILYLKTWY